MSSIEETLRELAARNPNPPNDTPFVYLLCPRCRTHIPNANQPELCQNCQRTLARGYEISSMTGRRANGAERDSGRLYHARTLDTNGTPSHRAVCGATPGRRSDWGAWGTDNEVTCQRCKKKLAK